MPALLAAAGCAASASAANALRVTGRDLVVNGVADVPAALFSMHHGPEATPGLVDDWGLGGVRFIRLTTNELARPSAAPFVLDCLFDRYQPAVLLHDPLWEENLCAFARRYAASAAEFPAGSRAVEFWNEPYLNWASKPAVNYDGLYYNLAEAAPGAPVRPAAGGDPIPGLVWDAPKTVAYATNPQFPDYVATRFMPAGTKAGEEFLWRGEIRHTVSRSWVHDVAQPSWWSGPVNLRYYLAMAEPFAKALKDASPDVPFIAGWGFHLFEGDWKSWDVLHRPTLDALHPWLDGYNEHHYAVDPRRVAMSYEVGYAYMLGAWGRRIGFWNTEAGGVQDPERPDSMHPLPGDGGASSRARESTGALQYFLRDVLTMLRTVPDKAKMRCAHEPQSTPGVPAGFRLLKPIRGRLCEVVSPEADIFAVAAREGNRLAVAVFNGTRSDVRRPLVVDAPRGTRLVSLERRRLEPIDQVGGFGLRRTDESASGNRWAGEVRLESYEAEVLVFQLEGEGTPDCIRRTQYAGRDIFVPVSGESPATFRIDLPADALAGATSAAVRWVFSRGSAAVSASCNGIPAAAPRSAPPLREAAIPLAALRPGENTLLLVADSSAEIGAATLILESETTAL